MQLEKFGISRKMARRLAEMGFQDFAGSTIVNSTGGWAALAGVLIIGARRGKFR